MNGRPRIAVAELSLHRDNNQSPCGYGFEERVALRRLLLCSRPAQVSLQAVAAK